MHLKLLLPTLAILALAGCASHFGSQSEEQFLPEIGDRHVLKPGNVETARAKLVLAGTEFPVKIDRDQKGINLTLRLVSKGEVLDVEKYKCGSEAFSLRVAGGESFKPSLPLLNYPVLAGQKWNWKGHVLTGDAKLEASANMQAFTDKLYFENSSWDAVKVVAHLDVQNPTGAPSSRELVFWFVPGKGLIKREFGSGSARVPFAP